MLTMLDLPDVDGPIIATTGEHRALGAHFECLYRSMMRFLSPFALSAVQVPTAQYSVTPSADEPISDWMPGDGRNHPGKLLQSVEALPAVGIPHEELSPVPAPTSRGQSGALGAAGYAHDSSLMPRQLLE